MTDDLHLVLGATGKTGSRVVAGLRLRGERVRPRSRSTSPRFDWHDETTWQPTLEGVTTVYLVAGHVRPAGDQHAMAPGRFAHEEMARFTRLAADRGVRHLVLLSGRTGLSGSHLIAPLEQAVRDAGTGWTILRPGSFAQNFLGGQMREAITAGHYRGFDVGGAVEDFVDAADIAAVAVEVLTTGGHDGAVYELSGPDALTTQQAVEMIARALDTTIRYTDTTPEVWAHEVRAQGMAEDAVGFVLTSLRSIREGYFRPRDGVQQVLGRAPRPFAHIVIEAAASGAWASR